MGKSVGTTETAGYRTVRVGDRKQKVHRVIWTYLHGAIEPGLQIDHINGKKADNRPANLRLACQSHNKCNVGTYRNNKTGFKGVQFAKGGKRYVAKITANGQSKYLGTFDDPRDAARAYDEEAVRCFGVYVQTNRSLGKLDDRQPEQLRFASSM